MGNSLMIGAAKMGMEFVAIAPKALWPDETLTKKMQSLAKETGAKITLSDSLDAVAGADAVYTDVWVSMGEESRFAERIALLEPYRVTMDVMHKTGDPKALFLHCLPSFHDLNTSVGNDIYEQYGLTEMEVSDEVFRSSGSVVFDEAENRMHTIKAVMVATLGDA
jgi:ornithine carbamoyltransferase